METPIKSLRDNPAIKAPPTINSEMATLHPRILNNGAFQPVRSSFGIGLRMSSSLSDIEIPPWFVSFLERERYITSRDRKQGIIFHSSKAQRHAPRVSPGAQRKFEIKFGIMPMDNPVNTRKAKDEPPSIWGWRSGWG
ncbi:hypothetical protein, partial [uncultured Fretibacterium sp.]|uniref:hypothetical protein n=1 Tax=uncultured Fretibacterium sp. TaxID=1678694 RepID=UPI002625B94B